MPSSVRRSGRGRVIQEQLRSILTYYDFILLPVSPSLPWPVGDQLNDPVANYLADIYTVLANLAGLPAIAIPAGIDPEGHLPVGYQLMADLWEEEALLSFADRIKK